MWVDEYVSMFDPQKLPNHWNYCSQILHQKRLPISSIIKVQYLLGITRVFKKNEKTDFQECENLAYFFSIVDFKPKQIFIKFQFDKGILFYHLRRGIAQNKMIFTACRHTNVEVIWSYGSLQNGQSVQMSKAFMAMDHRGKVSDYCHPVTKFDTNSEKIWKMDFI